MLTEKEYEQIYCSYCDSQRCLKYKGTTLAEKCPYWEAHQNNNKIKENPDYNFEVGM